MPTDIERRRVFEQCINDQAASLYRVAYRLLGCRDLAQDLVQETYCQAWRGLESLVDITKIRGWLFAILRNQYSKLLRRGKRWHTMGETLEMVDRESNSDLIHQERNDLVQYALEQLSEDHKLPILLVTMEGWSVAEAAEWLDVPEGTVLSRLHRGREKLRRIIAAEVGH